jgi:catechol 2,3-dioxygenase-like lactoylglutathione lyase family enzyme
MAEFPAPAEGIVLTHFIVASDVDRTRRFYADVLGGEVLREGCRQSSGSRTAGSSSTWAAHPPDDKPTVTLETPRDPITSVASSTSASPTFTPSTSGGALAGPSS